MRWDHSVMRTTFLPPHLAAQTFASQPGTRAQQPAAAQTATPEGGFEALALKSATPTRVIVPRAVEPKPAAAPAPSAAPAPAAPAPASSQTPALDRLLRPGSRLDIRV
jgi:soluble lytic murein transglycosylase-like protein